MSSTDTTADRLRQQFDAVPAPAAVDVTPALRAGQRELRHRRWRTGLGMGLPLAVAVALVALVPSLERSPYELVGTGLTLKGSPSAEGGPVQVDDDRVDLGDGVQVWREGSVLHLSAPGGHGSWIDTSDPTAVSWDDLGYDVGIFDDPGEVDGSTLVIGTVKGYPVSVSVTLNGITEPATVACYEQALGWCTYKVVMPTTYLSHDQRDQPTVSVR